MKITEFNLRALNPFFPSQKRVDSIEMKDPILVIGAPRSGTSLTAGIVHLCGAWAGQYRQESRHNPKGTFENRTLKKQMVKPFLKALGADPKGQHPLPPMDVPVQEGWRERVKNIIVKQGYKGGEWLFKDPKMTLQWQVWADAFPDAKWVIVRRPTEQIADSCLRTSFMKAHSNKEDWLQYAQEHVDRMDSLKASGADVREIWSNNLVAGQLDDLHEMIEWSGLEWQDEEIKDFIEPEFWHAPIDGIKSPT